MVQTSVSEHSYFSRRVWTRSASACSASLFRWSQVGSGWSGVTSRRRQGKRVREKMEKLIIDRMHKMAASAHKKMKIA